MASRRSALLKHLFLGLLLALLVLPAIQSSFHLVELPELGGYAEKAPHPDFTWPQLLDNTYQPALEKYVEDRIGFREVLIRVRNQVAYSLFQVCKANKVLVGEKGVLLDEVAIRAYLGQNFKGDDAIRVDVRKLKAVQDTLAKRGILLVFAIAPDKANFYPEYHPAYFRHQPRTQSNYDAYAREMKRRGVNLVDFAPLFRRWKDTASYPLFPRGGIHWSGYGITLAADTLFRYVAQRGHFNLPDYTRTGRTITNEPRETDNDIAKSLNLLREPAAYTMSYPDIKFEEPKPGQKRPNLLVVGDSFVWSFLVFYPYLKQLFSDKSQFWYYNASVDWGHRPDMPASRQVWELDTKAEILAQDVVLVMFTQHNLIGFDSNFTNKTYDLFYPYTAADQTRIQAIEARIRQSTAEQDELWEQAAASKRDYNELLHEKAIKEYELSRL